MNSLSPSAGYVNMYAQFVAQQPPMPPVVNRVTRPQPVQRQLLATPEPKTSCDYQQQPSVDQAQYYAQYQQQQQAPPVPEQASGDASQPTPRVPNRSRAAYNRYQREFLNAVFERVHYPSRLQRDAISNCLGNVVNQNQIKVWFQNARRRAVLRGNKPPPSRPNPPPVNTGPASEMVDNYFATIRHFVDQIASLGDDSAEPPAQPVNKLKRPRPAEDSEAPSEPKRPAVVSPPTAEPAPEVSPSTVVSPQLSDESGIASSSFAGSNENSEEVRSDSAVGNQSTVSPNDPRSYLGGSRASSGFMSSLSNYTSPPLVSSTPPQDQPAAQYPAGYSNSCAFNVNQQPLNAYQPYYANYAGFGQPYSAYSTYSLANQLAAWATSAVNGFSQ